MYRQNDFEAVILTLLKLLDVAFKLTFLCLTGLKLRATGGQAN